MMLSSCARKTKVERNNRVTHHARWHIASQRRPITPQPGRRPAPAAAAEACAPCARCGSRPSPLAAAATAPTPAPAPPPIPCPCRQAAQRIMCRQLCSAARNPLLLSNSLAVRPSMHSAVRRPMSSAVCLPTPGGTPAPLTRYPSRECTRQRPRMVAEWMMSAWSEKYSSLCSTAVQRGQGGRGVRGRGGEGGEGEGKG